MIPYFSVLRC